MREWKLSDAWSFSPWTESPAQPHIPGVNIPKAPQAPRAPRQKRVVPGIDDLYDIQKDLLKVMAALDDLEGKEPRIEQNADYRKAVKNTRNAYRIINRYLRKWGDPNQLGTF